MILRDVTGRAAGGRWSSTATSRAS